MIRGVPQFKVETSHLADTLVLKIAITEAEGRFPTGQRYRWPKIAFPPYSTNRIQLLLTPSSSKKMRV